MLLGFAYGSLFGTMPAIMIEWFNLGECTCSPWLCIAYTVVLTHDTLAHMSERSMDNGHGLLLSSAGASSRSC